MTERGIGMLLFVILKLTHMTNLGWWWILGGIFGTVAPMGLIFCVGLMRIFGFLSADMPWWSYVLIVIVDLIEFHLLRKAVTKFFWK